MPRRISFEDLLTAMVRDRLLVAPRAKALADKKDTQMMTLVRARMAAEKGTVDQHKAAITPVDLFMSFGEKGDDDKPIKEDAVTELYAKEIGFPYVKLDPLKLDPDFTVSVLPKPFAKKNSLLALSEKNGVITFATMNPFDTLAHESVERVTSKKLDMVIASRSDIDRLILDFYGFRRSVQRAEQVLNVGIDLGNLEQLVRMKSEQEIDSSDEHVVHAVDYLFRYAFEQRASDIHIEPKRTESQIRFRIDGKLHKASNLPRIVHNAVINRLKMLARLDIAEKRRPQDGRIKTEYKDRGIDIRVSSLPVAFGEKIVLRIFDPGIMDDDLGALGFPPRDKRVFEELMALPHGIVLVTGPTGSGKTTTLYTALRKLATEDVNISTIEDPIEMVFEGINQTAVNMTLGIGFAECLRTLLRQDPDILMVGEIRDLETGRHAIQAALTGHLVFSTLHTNDASSAVSRLLDLGVESFLLSSTLSGVLAQRLVRKVCNACRTSRALTDDEAALLGLEGEPLVDFGKGCVDCRHTGYSGRAAITELFKVTPAIRAMIHERKSDDVVKARAKEEGMLTLRESAVARMLEGVTTYEEVVEVTAEV